MSKYITHAKYILYISGCMFGICSVIYILQKLSVSGSFFDKNIYPVSQVLEEI